MQQVELNLNDIELAVNIIDTVTARGAFRGEELLAVGTLRARMAAFLAAGREAQTKQDTDEVLVDTASEQ